MKQKVPFLLLPILFASLAAVAQTSPNLDNGVKSYGSYEGGKIDTVNLSNGNLMLKIPVPFQYPQRGNLDRDYAFYLTSKNWSVQCIPDTQSSTGLDCQWTPGVPANCVLQFMPGPTHQLQMCPFPSGASVTSSFDLVLKRTLENEFLPSGTTYDAFGYSLVTWDLAVHNLASLPLPPNSNLARLFETTDNTGYRVEVSGSDAHGIPKNVVVVDRAGNRFLGTFPDSDQIVTGFRDPWDGVPPDVMPNGTYMPLADGSGGGSNTDYFSGQYATFTSAIDTNGNLYDLASAIDTLGHAQPAGSVAPDSNDCASPLPFSHFQFYTYAGPDGAAHSIKLCYSSFPIQTNFSPLPDVSQAGSTFANPGLQATPRLDLLATLVLPDHTKWTFNYDSYGEVTSVGLPTGGSIAYTWTEVGLPACGDLTPVSRAVATRTVNDNNGNSALWQYNWGTLANNTVINRVTDPNGNDTEHVFTGGCFPFETSTLYYQGSGGARQLLKRVDTSYSSANIEDDVSSGQPANVFATEVTTTLYPSRHVSKVHRDPAPGPGTGLPSFGNVAKELEYDWDIDSPGQLLRETDTVYQWQKNSDYLSSNLLDLPASTVVISPVAASNTKPSCPISPTTTASCMAETDYSYDEPGYLTTPTPAITTQHQAPPGPVRGNSTTASQWLSTGTTWAVSHTNWYDTGEPHQKIDALGHVTELSYDPAYAGAYLTQTCSPATAGGAVTHCVSGTYDPNTGVLATFTDQNGQTSNYGYDGEFKITSASGPIDSANGGARAQDLFAYSSTTAPNAFPVTITRQKSVTPGVMDSATTTFDGVGRMIKAEHAMPSGPPSTVVTTYLDHLNQVSVTNPFFTTGDSTYGSTTTQSDALGRALTITEQDGSTKAISYNVVAPTGTLGDCNISIDETGNQRRTCSDALGRLVEVDELGGNYPGAQAHGDLTVGGSLRFSSVNSAQATGSITITGREDSVTYPGERYCAEFTSGNPPRCVDWEMTPSTTAYNSGTVTVYVNGQAFSPSYGSAADVTSIANSLAGSIRSGSASVDYSTVVTNNSANPPVATISIYARTAGSGGNGITLGTASSTYDHVNFSGPSFATSTSGGTLTGGVNGGITGYDSGHVALRVGSFTGNTVSYSQTLNSNAADLANAVASAFNNTPGAPATAVRQPGSASIHLTYHDYAQAGNVAVTLVTTDNDPAYPGASFSGSTLLAGGQDPTGPSLDHNYYVTLYSYGALGNLLCVEQHGNVTGTGCSASPASDATSPWRVRRFTYDSLSRLLSAHNPESGTITYSYDADGNLLQKTSPAPNQPAGSTATQTISYCYDELHRVTGKAWSAQSCPLASAVVTYTYDSGANAKGKLTGVTDQAGTAGYTYDVLGRLSGETRTIAGITKSMSYAYNLDGSVQSMTYPSQSLLTYVPDSAGRVTGIIDGLPRQDSDVCNGCPPPPFNNFVAGATYGADNQVTAFVSGNSSDFAGITNTFTYNKRLQPINMSANAPGQTVFSTGYDFHVGNGTSGSDNGNVWNIYNYRDRSRDQSFTYDLLNRLTSAQNAGTDCNALVLQGKNKFWGNNYNYDPWGNLTNKTKISTACAGELLSAPALVNNQLSGYGYDAAGNMTSDPTDNVTATYDAENRIASASTTSGTFTYTYDADGNRVEKSGSGSGTLYWYMTRGIVAESDLIGNLKSEYVFFNGERVARKDFDPSTHAVTGVFYYFSDLLKTASVITDSTGNIKAESDYYPWGGELQFVNNDSNHYKFTGKERDTESGLDYFGARYYSNGLGRFITPDWAAKPVTIPYAVLGDPQTLNLYTYVRNLPTARIDPEGHENLKPQDWGQTPNTTPVEGDPIPDFILNGFAAVTGHIGDAFFLAQALHDWRSGDKTGAAMGALAVLPGEKLLGSVWQMGNFARGVAIEMRLGKNLASGFPVIDKFVKGVATSIKSIDLTSKTYQDTAKLAKTLDGYIGKVAKFNGAKYGKDVVEASAIKARELQVAVPTGSMSDAQKAVFDAASANAQKQGVRLTVTEIR